MMIPIFFTKPLYLIISILQDCVSIDAINYYYYYYLNYNLASRFRISRVGLYMYLHPYLR